jgi:hypothetical protein
MLTCATPCCRRSFHHHRLRSPLGDRKWSRHAAHCLLSFFAVGENGPKAAFGVPKEVVRNKLADWDVRHSEETMVLYLARLLLGSWAVLGKTLFYIQYGLLVLSSIQYKYIILMGSDY